MRETFVVRREQPQESLPCHGCGRPIAMPDLAEWWTGDAWSNDRREAATYPSQLVALQACDAADLATYDIDQVA